jgi:hypothetical protein
MDLDEIIEKIVFMIFNCEVTLNDPYVTIEEIKEKLKEDC